VYIERKQDIAINYWLKNLFSDAPFVTVVDGFPQDDLVLPTISVEWSTLETYSSELGNRELGKKRMWFLDIFAKDKAQRDEYAFRILHALEDGGISVYDYDLGFPPTATPKIGCILPDSIAIEIIQVMAELTDLMHYRATVSFKAEFSQS
jgi:hypothetical protein